MSDFPSTHRVYDGVVALTARLGYCPTRNEIAAEVGLARATVQHHLRRLSDWGWVSMPTNGERRALVVVSPEKRAS